MLFDLVFYGDQPASADDARSVLDLDDALRTARPARRDTTAPTAHRRGAPMSPQTTSPETAPRRSWLRRNRGLTILVVTLLVVVALLSLLTARQTTQGEPLDPANPSPDGAQAVARVLEQQGVQLTVVRRAAELERATVDADTTVMVTSPDHLGTRDRPAGRGPHRSPPAPWCWPSRGPR